ncbi:MAG: histidine kinase [Saprospiraceae bacterium]|nr:histidine kinase [Saprospiraceae bacterium]
MLLVLPAFAERATAQVYNFQHYGIEEGLPSTEVHDIHQDAKGYIWFATDHGLCRFDGFEFRVFSTLEGLTDNTIFDIVEQADGSLLLTTYTGGVCVFENGKGRPFPNNDRLKTFLGDYYIHHLQADSTGNLTFRYMLSGRRQKPVCLMDTAGEITCLPLAQDIRFTQPQIPPGEERAFFQSLNAAIDSGDLFVEYGDEILRGPSGRIFWVAEGTFMGFNPGSGTIDTLLELGRIYALHEDHRGDLWYSAGQGEGLIRIHYESERIQSIDVFLPGQTISDIFEDRENNLWVSTVESGIYFLPNQGIQIMDPAYGLNNKILSLAVWDDRLWAGQLIGSTFYLDDHFKPTLADECFHGASAFDLESVGDYLLSSSRCLLDKKAGYSILSVPWLNPKAVAIDEAGTFFIGGVLGLTRMNVNKDHQLTEFVLADSIAVYSLYLDAEKNLWVGSLSGLWRVQGDQVEDLRDTHPLLRVRITDIKGLENGGLVLGTKGEGILLYLADTLIQINTAEGLNSQFVKSIFVEDQETIWVGGNQGVNRLHFKPGSQYELERIESYRSSEGLPSNEVFDFAMFNGKLWMATSAGLCRADLSFFQDPPTAPKLLITGLSVNKTSYELDQELILDAGTNDIDFEYIGFYFRESAGVRYQYRLEGYDEEWRSTKLRKASFTNLPSGDYRFQVRAENPAGIWTDNPVSLSFQILKPYNEKWWFRILVILGILLVISGIFLGVMQRQRAKVVMERKIIQSEQTALRAQINPHFIFNAMNSIQYFITENDKQNAGVYLSRFSKLMRRILDNSKKNWISLEEELAGMRHYLELEQMRFSEKFDYRIETGPDVDLYETEIPSMILQPFLENAIWHGLMRKQEKGLLRIDFRFEGDFLRCTIEDNGIGREEAGKHSRRGHKSTGLQNVMERIHLVNAQNNTKMSVEIKDEYLEDGTAAGTRVTILFPRPKKKGAY